MANTKMTKKQVEEQERQDAIKSLQDDISKGETLYVIQRHVSQSGMKRVLAIYKLDHHDGEPFMTNYTSRVAEALGWKLQSGIGKTWGLVVNGAGMDMHFHTIYCLSRILFDDGYALNYQSL